MSSTGPCLFGQIVTFGDHGDTLSSKILIEALDRFGTSFLRILKQIPFLPLDCNLAFCWLALIWSNNFGE